MGVLYGDGYRRRGRNSFGGEFEASHCIQRGSFFPGCVRATHSSQITFGRTCYLLSIVIIPPPTRSSGRRYSVFQQKFLSFFFSFANGSSRLIYRQGIFIAQKVGYRRNFIKLVRNLGPTPIKIWGPENPQFRSIFGRSPNSPVHCSRKEQDIVNLKTDF